jgi:SET domain-containing protein
MHVNMKTLKTDNNKIEAIEFDYLFKNPSQLPNAGNGLFTAIDIYIDETIAVFKGEVLSNAEAKKRAQEGNDRYFINLLDNTIMDSMHTACFAKYANDAKGSPTATFKNNAEIVLDDNDKICIKATREIKANEEVFCSYGKKYWEKHS